MQPTHAPLRTIILGFWAVWFSLVVASNVTDTLKAAGWLAADWPFASGNYAQVVKTTSIYALPRSVPAVLFAGVIAWETLAAGLFWRAVCLSAGSRADTRADAALTVSIALWAAFILADELFVAYPTGIEGVHLRLFTASLASLVALRVATPR